jgi:hypothetical protein
MNIEIDNDWTEAGLYYINKTISIFSNLEVISDMKMDGLLLDPDINFNYFINVTDHFINVQMCDKSSENGISYMFGVYLYKKDNIAHVYHNGFGPFNKYNFKYEN